MKIVYRVVQWTYWLDPPQFRVLARGLTSDQATHLVASYRVIGWSSKHLYSEEDE